MKIHLIICGLLAGIMPMQQNFAGTINKNKRSIDTLGIGSTITDYPEVQWIQGEPVTKLDKHKIYIIECWATWCHPCVSNIPHVNELAEKFKGKVMIIGQSVWEEDKKKVADFVTKKGNDMSYTVAYSGGKESDFSKKILLPAKVDGIPTAFLIQDNKIIWIANAADLTEEALQMAVDHRFSITTAENEAPGKLSEDAMELADSGYYDKAILKINEVVAKNPRFPFAVYTKYGILIKQNKKTEALAVLKKSYEENPAEFEQTYFNGLFSSDQFDTLIPMVESALKYRPEDTGILQFYLRALSKKRDYTQATQVINHTISSDDPSFLSDVASIGFTLDQINNNYTNDEVEAATLKVAWKSMSLKPANPILAALMARGYMRTGNKAAATDVINRTLLAIKEAKNESKQAPKLTALLESVNKDAFPGLQKLFEDLIERD